MARARRGRTGGGQVRVFGRDGDVLPTDFKTFPVRTENAVTRVLFVMVELGIRLRVPASSRRLPANALCLTWPPPLGTG